MDFKIGTFAIGLATLVFAGLVWRASLDLSAGSHVLGIDELTSFDAVRNILHPGDLRGLVWHALDGIDQRYGRALYLLIAIFGFIPERLFGESGQIVAGRILVATLLLSSYWILAWTFLKSWIGRGCAIAALLSLPFTSYYSLLPKPEPLALFLMALFFRSHIRRGFGFGPHWILPGMAFGSKIANVTQLPVLLIGSLFLQPKGGRARGVLIGLLYYLLGLGFSVPSLFVGKLDQWLNWTFRFTQHGLDVPDLTWRDWLVHIAGTYFPGNLTLTVAVASVAVLWVTGLRRALSAKKTEDWKHLWLIGCGLSLGIPIIAAVKRLWGMYLHPAAVLTVVGTLGLVEAWILEKRSRLGHWASIVLLLSAARMGMLLAPRSARVLHQASLRTASPVFVSNLAHLNLYVEQARALRGRLGRKIRVAYDANLLRPREEPDIQVDLIWGPFLSWESKYDLVLGYADLLGRMSEETSRTRVAPVILEADRLYRGHLLSSPEAPCPLEPCYVRFLPDAFSPVIALLRRDLLRN